MLPSPFLLVGDMEVLLVDLDGEAVVDVEADAIVDFNKDLAGDGIALAGETFKGVDTPLPLPF